ncbi:MAG: DinB family protein, partial [Mariprofundaceae bacterium]
APASLREILFDEMDDFIAGRERLDELIVDFSKMFTEELLAEPICYHNMAGEEQEGLLGPLLQHLFNHQTHHRGQVTTLLYQAGIDPGPLDLTAMLQDEGTTAPG